jgi:DNA repair exonuclease SbcCD nuclease subunit
MRIVLLGDTHLGASKSSDIMHDYFSKFYKFMFSYMAQNDIKTIIQEGDLYDYRREVHFNTLHKTASYFFEPIKDNGIQLIALCGNHDSLYTSTNRVNSLRLLLNHENMHVIDMEPETLSLEGVDIDFYPWINPENLEKSLAFARNSTSPWAIGHFEFANFPLLPGSMAEHGMDHKIFSKYDRVFSGHYHTGSVKDNVIYTATPYELNWSDCNDSKGFWVLETDDMSYEFVKNPYTLFIKVLYEDDLVFDFESIRSKYVKLIVVQKLDQKKFDAFVDSMNAHSPHSMSIIETSIVDSVTTAMASNIDVLSTQNMIENVIDSMVVNLDKPKLKSHVMSYYTEAMSILNAL